MIASTINQDHAREIARYSTMPLPSADYSVDLSKSIWVQTYWLGKKVTNQRVLNLLNKISQLEEGWDEEDAIAPSTAIISKTKELIKNFNTLGQKVYHIAPGPDGEIMINLRNDGRSIEIILYPSKSIYVRLSPNEKPEQGSFTHELIPQLISWVNG